LYQHGRRPFWILKAKEYLCDCKIIWKGRQKKR
jgi:hypothetical protein